MKLGSADTMLIWSPVWRSLPKRSSVEVSAFQRSPSPLARTGSGAPGTRLPRSAPIVMSWRFSVDPGAGSDSSPSTSSSERSGRPHVLPSNSGSPLTRQ